MKKGLVHVYYGEGKGKTTTAIGLAVRAAGWGLKVKIVQFLKGRETGEGRFLKGPRIRIESFGRKGFVDPKKLTKKDFEKIKKGFNRAKEAVLEGDFDLVVLDEIGAAVKFGLIREDEVIGLVKRKPDKVEVVLTGRWMGKKIINTADYVTEFKEVKHPYKKGVKARKGMEY